MSLKAGPSTAANAIDSAATSESLPFPRPVGTGTPYLARLPQSSYQTRRSRTHTRPSERLWGPYTQHLVRPTLRRQKAPGTAKGRTRAARCAQRAAGGTRGALLLLSLLPHRKWTEWAAWCTLVSSRSRLRRRAHHRLRGEPLAGVQRLPIWWWARVVPMVAAEELYAPVDDGHGAAIGAVAVWQERVVHPDAL